MSSYPIPGANRASYDATPTEQQRGKKPFPFDASGWSNYTATVTDVSIFIDEEKGNDQLVVKAENGPYQVRFYCNVDPTIVGPQTTDVEKAIAKNLDKLLLIGKCLDIVVPKGDGLVIDTSRFPKAVGKVISFGITQAKDSAGKPKMNSNGYPKPASVFNGLAKVMEPVDDAAPF